MIIASFLFPLDAHHPNRHPGHHYSITRTQFLVYTILPHAGSSHGSIDTVPVEIRRLTIPEFSVHCPSFVDIYLAAMDYPTSMKERQVSHWRRDTIQPGFQALCAVEQGFITGFAYGFLGTRDHWWYHQLAKGVRDQAPSSPLHWQILASYFEVAEVHVAPSYQSRGIGRLLLRGLTHQVPALYSVLSTPEVPDEANAAFHLYRSEGYQDFLRHHYFSGDSRPFAVLYSPTAADHTML